MKDRGDNAKQTTTTTARYTVLFTCRWRKDIFLHDGGSSKCLVVVHSAELNPCPLFNLSYTSLKVDQGEKYQPFVPDSVFQISQDEGRGWQEEEVLFRLVGCCRKKPFKNQISTPIKAIGRADSCFKSLFGIQYQIAFQFEHMLASSCRMWKILYSHCLWFWKCPSVMYTVSQTDLY